MMAIAVLFCMLLLPLSVTGEEDSRIVAFAGAYATNYYMELNDTDVTIGWSNMIYRNNSTVFVRVLPTADNSLYLYDEGTQNDTFIVNISIRTERGRGIENYNLVHGRYTTEVAVDEEERVDVIINIHLTEHLPLGNYSARFLIASKEYGSEDDREYGITEGISGAIDAKSISTEQFIVVTPEVVTPEQETIPQQQEQENKTQVPYTLIIILVGGSLLVLFLIITKRRANKKIYTMKRDRLL